MTKKQNKKQLTLQARQKRKDETDDQKINNNNLPTWSKVKKEAQKQKQQSTPE